MTENSNTSRQRPEDGVARSAISTTAEDSYDPHVERDVPYATTNFETLVHLVKAGVGTGILCMPQAFSRAGLIVGIVSTITIGSIITHCLHILVRSQYVLCKQQHVALLTYPASMTAAMQVGPSALKCLARPAAPMVDFFLIVYQLGVCCAYILFIGSTLKKLLDDYYNISLTLHCLIILLPLMGINCIRNLKALAPFSTAANILILLGLGIIIYYLVSGEQLEGELDMVGDIYELPLFFGTVQFALATVGVVITLENNMKTPKSFGTPLGVLNLGMGFIIFLYTLIGALGYMYCISKCEDSISLNIPPGTASLVLQAMYAVAIFISYALNCYPPVDVLWRFYLLPRLELRGSQHLLLWEYLLRIGLCFFTFLLAITVPELGLIISLFGAFCLSALALMFPTMMEFCVSFPDSFGTCWIKLIKDLLVFMFGFFGMVVGTYSAVAAMVDKAFES